MDAAIYTRISRDPSGVGAGVARQQEDCERLARDRGIRIRSVYTDNDTSAYTSTPRPGYRALLDSIRAGEVGVVIVWHTDRLYRRMSDLEEYISICQPRDVPTLSVQAGPLDLTTPSGRMVARTLGSVAQYESEQKAERQRRANYQRALQGRHFGTRRCFGYEADGVTVRDAEAVAIRDAFQSVLNGVSLAAISRRWNRLGLRTPQAGNFWDATVLSRTLRTLRLAGFRTYRRQALLEPDGNPVKGEWPPIVDEDTWHAVQAVLNDPQRRSPYQPQGLLSGVAVCDTCGAIIHSGGSRNGRRRYRCSGKGGHAYREAEPIDKFVTEVVLTYLRRPDILRLITPPKNELDIDDVRAKIADTQQRADGLVSAYADGIITIQQLRHGQDRLTRQRSHLEAQLPAPRNALIDQLAQAKHPASVWQALDTEERRQVIGGLLEVRIKATRTKEATYLDWRQRVLNPDSLCLTWKNSIDQTSPAPRTKRRVPSGAMKYRSR